MGTEKFCLKWNDFEANISHAFRDIRDTKDFLDVTLVCETDEQLQAHKVILSACSPFFRKILARNPHQHPLLYLKGVKFGDLQSVLNFMYHGEVNVAQDELNSFLAVAEELKVKGLTQNNSSSNNTNNVKSPPPSSSKPSRSMERETPAVAHHTTASFIRVVGSEFVQKYLGEGPRMVRDVFRLAKENSPAIIFIDEIDAIATKRFDAQTGADREVQRILLELLNQMDGFDQTTNVKVIMATNRQDTLDPALLRPGRLDRKIEFPLPDRRQKRLIFSTITGKMNLSDEVDLEDFVARPDRISGADINAICQEAGMHAVRENRYIVLPKDFEKGYKNNIKKDESEHEFYK